MKEKFVDENLELVIMYRLQYFGHSAFDAESLVQLEIADQVRNDE